MDRWADRQINHEQRSRDKNRVEKPLVSTTAGRDKFGRERAEANHLLGWVGRPSASIRA